MLVLGSEWQAAIVVAGSSQVVVVMLWLAEMLLAAAQVELRVGIAGDYTCLGGTISE